MVRVIKGVGAGFDWLEKNWESSRGRRCMANVLVAVFVFSLVGIECNRAGLFPLEIAAALPTNHLVAIEVAFTLLLLFEAVSLVLSFAESVSVSVGKQFEILSLILLRDTFKVVSHLEEPLAWAQVKGHVGEIFATAVSALFIFGMIGLYYRLRRPVQPAWKEGERHRFIVIKKGVAGMLLAGFCWILLKSAKGMLFTGELLPVFESFYTLLIFSDVLMVLLSIRYSAGYLLSFRNSAFAVSTVMIRIALIAPIHIGAGIGALAVTFTLGVLLIYNHLAEAAGMMDRSLRSASGSPNSDPPDNL